MPALGLYRKPLKLCTYAIRLQISVASCTKQPNSVYLKASIRN